MSAITGARSAARLFAFAALMALPAAEPSAAAGGVRLAGLLSGSPRALRAASAALVRALMASRSFWAISAMMPMVSLGTHQPKHERSVNLTKPLITQPQSKCFVAGRYHFTGSGQ